MYTPHVMSIRAEQGQRINPDYLTFAKTSQERLQRERMELDELREKQDRQLAAIAKPLLKRGAQDLSRMGIFPQIRVANSLDTKPRVLKEELMFVDKEDLTPGYSTQEYYLNPKGELLYVLRVYDRKERLVRKPNFEPASNRAYAQLAERALQRIGSIIENSVRLSQQPIDIGRELFSGTATARDILVWTRQQPKV